MRIIAGEFRGRTLLPPAADDTRPITDRAKQSLFDILSPRIPDALVYDVFSGTGSMGLECLSRGAQRAVFYEKDRSATDRLRKNICTFKVADRTEVMDGDVFRFFGRRDGQRARHPHLIFLDPPYRFVRERQTELLQLAASLAAHLAHDGALVFRHDVADVLELPALHCYDRRTYGTMAIELLYKPPADPIPPPF